MLAKFKRLRGTLLDPFGHTAERRQERALIRDYEEILEEILEGLSADNHHSAVEIAELPVSMRGFGHVKAANIAAARARQEALIQHFRRPPPRALAA